MTASRTARGALLAFAGGTLGTLARAALVEHAAATSVPLATLGINVAGAFILGTLVGRLSANLRLFLGSGLLGGFTTYSALAVQTGDLLHSGHPTLALAYGLGTVVLGFGASLAGIGLARMGARR